MIWTILILLVAIALFVFGGSFFPHDAKKPVASKIVIAKIVKLISVILLIVGVNRLGLGTTHYLTQSNPAILQEMANNMQAQQAEIASRVTKKYVREHAAEMIADAPIVAGDVNAKKTIFMFSDHFCPYCVRMHGILDQIVATNPDVRVVLKNMPLPMHGPQAQFTARATIAAKIQDNAKAAALDKWIMEDREALNKGGKDGQAEVEQVKKNVFAHAAKIGLDVKKLESDINGEVVNREMNQVQALAGEFQVRGTPYLIVEGQVSERGYDYQTILEALK
ncbi:MAG: thioredoxin domain-containing protein [Rickettsiales bacterium]|jgi:protein-disulfide isomerase|nr:thioredoxin domain-containing protein [Rickettsiales bacterium]